MGVTNDEGVRAIGIICFFCACTIQKGYCRTGSARIGKNLRNYLVKGWQDSMWNTSSKLLTLINPSFWKFALSNILRPKLSSSGQSVLIWEQCLAWEKEEEGPVVMSGINILPLVQHSLYKRETQDPQRLDSLSTVTWRQCFTSQFKYWSREEKVHYVPVSVISYHPASYSQI